MRDKKKEQTNEYMDYVNVYVLGYANQLENRFKSNTLTLCVLLTKSTPIVLM